MPHEWQNRYMDARYARQTALPGFGASGQERLAAASVLVIGAGGLGSTVIPALAAAGVGTIGIVDDDTVELSNLHRQHIHGTSDIGLSKVQSAMATVAGLNPDCRVIPITDRLTAENALELFSRFDLVLDGSDNFATRYLASDAAELTGIPIVWGAVSQYGGQVGTTTPDSPGYRDLFPTPPPPGSVLSCAVGGVLPTVCGVIGSIMATEAIKLITGVGTPLIGTVSTFDALSGRFRELRFDKDPTAAPVTGLIDYDAFCGLAPDVTALSPAELAARLGAGEPLTLIDVREPWEAAIASLPDAKLIPLGGLAHVLDELDPAEPVVVYCHHGIRSEQARLLLASRGFAVAHLAGGIDAWARDIDRELARY